jgi:site-specific DNA-methyltransferase (adenine-specific)
VARVEIHHGDNLPLLASWPAASFDLIYVDPPFNTGRMQRRVRQKSTRDDAGDRLGFYGQRYKTTRVGASEFDDAFDDYLAFLEPRLIEARRLLAPTGSFFLHLDCREVHYAKVLCDRVFGRDCFQNEIIWAYDYGARTRSRWPAKHDNILWYSADPERYTYDYDAIDRIPYLAPELVGPEKAARGKTPTDVWWHTIVSPTGKEKTGYPTQKPLGILRRIVAVHSEPGDRLLDFFAGSGSFGAAALELGRDCVLVDSSAEAVRVMRERFDALERRAAVASGAGGTSAASET